MKNIDAGEVLPAVTALTTADEPVTLVAHQAEVLAYSFMCDLWSVLMFAAGLLGFPSCAWLAWVEPGSF